MSYDEYSQTDVQEDVAWEDIQIVGMDYHEKRILLERVVTEMLHIRVEYASAVAEQEEYDAMMRMMRITKMDMMDELPEEDIVRLKRNYHKVCRQAEELKAHLWVLREVKMGLQSAIKAEGY
jgi:hypothetical protein